MKISINEQVEISFNIQEKIGAARGSLKISFQDIVSSYSGKPDFQSRIKLAGTEIPRVVRLGTFLDGRQKEFWYTKKGRNDFLVIVLKSNFYSKIIIKTENSQQISQKINDRIKDWA